MTDSTARLKALRQALAAAGLDGWLVPRGDAFAGEEVQAADERLAWISGFSGSAGCALITADAAVLWSDGRYALQMQNETDSNWQCYDTAKLSVSKWLAENLTEKARIGFDAMLMPVATHTRLLDELKTHDAEGIALVAAAQPLDALWDDRPPRHISQAWNVDAKHHGRGRDEKIAAAVAMLKEQDADALVISAPTELAWLLNMRGMDLAHTPIVLAFGLLTADGVVMVFHEKSALEAIDKEQMEVHPPAHLNDALAAYKGRNVWIDPAHCPFALTKILEAAGAQIIQNPSPLGGMKVIKNAVEASGFRAAHRRDGLAMVRFLAWLDGVSGGLTEMQAAEKLHQFRREGDNYLMDSFAAISAAGAHGAIIHYRATPATDAPLAPDNLYLVDSGAQYHEATTDITRTLLLGTPPQDASTCYSHVLKAHIALDRQQFPHDTTGAQLDAITRRKMWDAGLNYGHGTGHGVGACLGVHEPPSIAPKASAALKAGMVLSNEPGYYREGAFGIRLENLVLVVDKGEGFLGFEHLTLVPFDRRLIAVELLTPSERDWLNAYHSAVREAIAPQIASLTDSDEREAVATWLEAATAPL